MWPTSTSPPSIYDLNAVITAGVDLASQRAKTALCVLEWRDHRATVEDMTLDVADDEIAALTTSADKLGIDVPLGWPVAFADAIHCFSHTGNWPSSYRHDDNRAYRYRRTDLWVWENLGGPPPLSVSSDRIALPAMRAAALLARLPTGYARNGSEVVIEVYPAAALRRWDLPATGYKGKDKTTARRDLLAGLRSSTAWLRIPPEHVELCIQSDDAFDALISALVARAAKQALIDPIPDEDAAFACREGWIAVPIKSSLARLP